ncbi:MAG: flagellar biosynthetic protein FliO, partial [Clostridiales bacterium]|nr:flagellar biosynthetic protein FliO [Clostridiales bacterium]
VSAYYVTKFVAKKGKKLTKSKHINVIDQIYLAVDKQIALINVGGKTILVGITNQAINCITEFEEDKQIHEQQQEEITQKVAKDWPTKIVNLFKKVMNSQKELKKARASNTSGLPKLSFIKAKAAREEDRFDEMMRAIEKRKEQHANISKRGARQ